MVFGPKHMCRSWYLHKFFKENKLHKLSNVLILSNGNSLKLKAIKIRGKKLKLPNTCVLDSVFQLFLAAVYDCHVFADKCRLLAQKNVFFPMVFDKSEKAF